MGGYVHVWINYRYFEKKSEQFCLKIRSTLICSNIHHRSQIIGQIRFEIGRIWTGKNSQSRTTKIELILLCEVVSISEKEVCLKPPVCCYFYLFLFLCGNVCSAFVSYIAEILLWN